MTLVLLVPPMSGLAAPLPHAAVRVLVAGPAPILREGLARLLDGHPEVEVAGTAASRDEALRLAARLGPDVLLADVRLLQDGSAAEVARVVALAEGPDPEALRQRVTELLDAGVAGFVSLRDEVEALFEAVRAVAAGEVWVSPRVAARLLPLRPDAAEAAGLTPRQRELLCRVGAGQPTTRIAAEMGLAQGTLRNHLSALYARLGVRTRAEAVAWAWQAGLVHRDAEGDGPAATPGRDAGER